MVNRSEPLYRGFESHPRLIPFEGYYFKCTLFAVSLTRERDTALELAYPRLQYAKIP